MSRIISNFVLAYLKTGGGTDHTSVKMSGCLYHDSGEKSGPWGLILTGSPSEHVAGVPVSRGAPLLTS